MKTSKNLKNIYNFLKDLLKRVPILHNLYKKIDFKKNLEDSLKFFHEHKDPQDNQRTTPPKSEKIEYHCAWVTEIYTPSNINNLIKSLKKLGWDQSDFSDEDLIQWIKKGRSSGRSTSWRNVEIISSKNNKGIGVEYTKLPPEVEFGRVSFCNITSSLIIVTIQFVFKDEIVNTFNKLLSSEYKTKYYSTKSHRKFYTKYIDVINQKKEEIKKEFYKVHKNLYVWFQQNFAALFGNYGELTKDIENYGGNNNAAFTNKLNLSLNPTISLLAIRSILLSYECQLSKIRDKTVSPIKRIKHALKDLNYVRNQFLSLSTDIQLISYDISEFIRSGSLYLEDCTDFSPPSYLKKNHPSFVKILKEEIEIISQQLCKLEVAVNKAIFSSSNLGSAIANIQVQRSVIRLTWVVIILTVLTIIISTISLYYTYVQAS